MIPNPINDTKIIFSDRTICGKNILSKDFIKTLTATNSKNIPLQNPDNISTLQYLIEFIIIKNIIFKNIIICHEMNKKIY